MIPKHLKNPVHITVDFLKENKLCTEKFYCKEKKYFSFSSSFLSGVRDCKIDSQTSLFVCVDYRCGLTFGLFLDLSFRSPTPDQLDCLVRFCLLDLCLFLYMPQPAKIWPLGTSLPRSKAMRLGGCVPYCIPPLFVSIQQLILFPFTLSQLTFRVCQKEEAIGKDINQMKLTTLFPWVQKKPHT